jgi:hypothetical protein
VGIRVLKAVTVSAFDLREDAPQEPFAESPDGLPDAVNLDDVYADPTDRHSGLNRSDGVTK